MSDVIPPPTKKRIVVVGDVTVDWNLASLQEWSPGLTWASADSVRATGTAGGGAFLGELIERCTDDVAAVRRIRIDESKLQPTNRQLPQIYRLWSRFESEHEKVWRVERVLGLDLALGPHAVSMERLAAKDDRDGADILVLDDAGITFRNEPVLWPHALRENGKPWVVWKLARPTRTSQLWQKIGADHAERLIALVQIGDLRRAGLVISKGLSWERTAIDVFHAVCTHLEASQLTRCKHVVVAIPLVGAILLSRGENPILDMETGRCRLLFDPKHAEGSLETGSGLVVGLMTCLTAAIARSLAAPDPAAAARPGSKPREPLEAALETAISRGIGAMNLLQKKGYRLNSSRTSDPVAQLSFPTDDVVKMVKDGTTLEDVAQMIRDGTAEAVAKTFKDGSTHLVAVDVPGDVAKSRSRAWTILENNQDINLAAAASTIVKFGVDKANIEAPTYRLGKLVVLDRLEAEGFSSICNLIQEFKSRRTAKPLSIAVFGPPGCGKSFGVTEIASAVLGKDAKILTFNLSQIESPAQIASSLHQVRDAVLSGTTPLVFWDEFDSLQLKWLRFFLAPMQDGTFDEGQVTHRIGKCVFVFAGGTSENFAKFEGRCKHARSSKGPDFVSRLQGYVDIVGPNTRIDSKNDAARIVRRALLLRNLLQKHSILLDAKRVAQIDSGVLRAMLLVDTYKHGARSMESVLMMSALGADLSLEPAHIPSQEQLSLHVPAEDFVRIMTEIPFTDEAVERMARFMHQQYSSRHEPGPTAPYAGLDWGKLPPGIQEENRELVRDIPKKLNSIGYRIVDAVVPAHGDIEAFIETLAEAEHLRWMLSKLEQGFRYGEPRDNEGKIHPALLPWQDMPTVNGVPDPEKVKLFGEYANRVGDAALPEDQKDKDRELMRDSVEALETVGLGIMPLKLGTP